MRRVVLSLRWWWLHALTLAAMAAFILLGQWQWDRAQASTGDLQNLLYSIQWWSFAVVAVVMWWKVMRSEARRLVESPGMAGAATITGSSTVLGISRPPTPVEDEDDPELAAYNAWLAALNARAERAR